MQSEKRAILNQVRESKLSPSEADRQLQQLMDSRIDHELYINGKIERTLNAHVHELEFISDIMDLNTKVEEVINSNLHKLGNKINVLDLNEYENSIGVLF